MYQNRLREGIAMLELVFAIVIMGIVMMSAPMLVSQANKGSLVGVQQESIAAGATHLGIILTRHWDENDTNESLESPILATDSGEALLGESVDSLGNAIGIRVGMPISSTRSFLTATGTRLSASAIPTDVNVTIFNDIADYNGNVIGLKNDGNTTTSEGDYLDKGVQLSTTVSYISDVPTSGGYNSSTLALNNPFGNIIPPPTTSNIKMITVTTTSNSGVAELQKNIVLRAFSCNIGVYAIAERRFP